MGAGSGAPELGVTGVDLTSRFPRGERGEMIPRLDRRASRVPLARSEGRSQDCYDAGKTIAQKERQRPSEICRIRRVLPAKNEEKAKIRRGDARIPGQTGATPRPIPGGAPAPRSVASHAARDRKKAT